MADQFLPQTIEMALSVISSQISQSAAVERVPLSKSGGRVLARDVHSPKNVPEHPLSAMDGYAFSLGSLNKTPGEKPYRLKVTGRSLAGHPLQDDPDPTGCIRIFTGAQVPDCCDVVIPQERVTLDEATATITFSPEGLVPLLNIRRAGEDIAAGAVALRAGTRISAQALALLASIGVGEVDVMQPIRVAVISTGDEVKDPGSPLVAGKIYDANRPMLLELIREYGALAIDLGIVPDDPVSLRDSIQHAAALADAIITSGGVSVGEADHTRATMQSLGEIAFWKLAIKPGRPLAAGWVWDSNHVKRIPFFGLPGNPVAAFVTFQGIVGPCLQQLAGATPVSKPIVRARLTRATKKVPGRTEFLRCTLSRDDSGEWLAEIAASQGAASLKSLVDADGLAVLPHASGPLSAGDVVDVMMLR